VYLKKIDLLCFVPHVHAIGRDFRDQVRHDHMIDSFQHVDEIFLSCFCEFSSSSVEDKEGQKRSLIIQTFCPSLGFSVLGPRGVGFAIFNSAPINHECRNLQRSPTI
jgi:hypothetical protein